MADRGHLIANHTYTHPNLALLSPNRLRTELSDCSKAIADATGLQPKFFRPPFGARRPAVLQVGRELGLEPVMWDVTCFDWRRSATAESVERCARRVIERDHTRGHVVLLHDGNHLGIGGDRAHTVRATESILSRYRKEYYFRRIDEV
jgi:peptidoglycan/xylan/chitin deacetylase (PgdA/CDA1 family)